MRILRPLWMEGNAPVLDGPIGAVAAVAGQAPRFDHRQGGRTPGVGETDGR